MQGQEQVVVASELRHLLGVDILPIFALLFAQMAASCVSMSVALRDAADGKQVCPLLHSLHLLNRASNTYRILHQ